MAKLLEKQSPFSNRTIQDAKKEKYIGPNKRTKRNQWGENIEAKIIALSPLPTTYDVTATQDIAFSEFTYTELMGGMHLRPQSVEISCRILEMASKIDTEVNHIENIMKIAEDKYVLKSIDKETPEKVVFLPGTNSMNVVSYENLCRLAFEDEDVFLKLHPVSNPDTKIPYVHIFGVHRVIDQYFSGMTLLKNAKIVYGTASTELIIYASIMKKDIVNVGSFFDESNCAYYPIIKMLFREQDKEKRIKILNNIIDCKYSGLIFPWMEDIEERINAFNNKCLELREIYKPLASKFAVRKQVQIPKEPQRK